MECLNAQAGTAPPELCGLLVRWREWEPSAAAPERAGAVPAAPIVTGTAETSRWRSLAALGARGLGETAGALARPVRRRGLARRSLALRPGSARPQRLAQ